MEFTREALQYWIIHGLLIVSVVYSRFDSAVISVAVLIAIFSNLGKRSGDSTSAYSIFNRGFRRLLGDIQPDAIDRQLRGGGTGTDNFENPDVERSKSNGMSNFPSKFINRPCPCGSGLKAKKCCASSLRSRVKPPSGGKKDETEYDFSQFEVLE